MLSDNHILQLLQEKSEQMRTVVFPEIKRGLPRSARDSTKSSRKDPAIPGIRSGSVTVLKMCIFPAPILLAASSIEGSSLSSIALKIRYATEKKCYYLNENKSVPYRKYHSCCW